jgi:hypothetical protein
MIVSAKHWGATVNELGMLALPPKVLAISSTSTSGIERQMPGSFRRQQQQQNEGTRHNG